MMGRRSPWVTGLLGLLLVVAAPSLGETRQTGQTDQTDQQDQSSQSDQSDQEDKGDQKDQKDTKDTKADTWPKRSQPRVERGAAPEVYEEVHDFEGITFRMVEQARHWDTSLPPRRTWEVDVNSDLVVFFDKPASKASDDASETEWATTLRLLNEMSDIAAELQTEVRKLNAAPAQATPDEALRGAFQKSQNRVATFFETLEELRPDDHNEIESGEAVDQESHDIYGNVLRWLEIEIGRLTEETQAITDEARIEVSVEATLSPLRPAARRLHVENYDKLDAGQLAPSDRQALDLTPEQRRWVDDAKKAQQAVRELDQKAKAAATELDKLPDDQRANATVKKMVADNKATANAAERLKNELTFRGIDEFLPEARVELQKAGLRPGDQVTVYVRFWRRTTGENGEPTRELIYDAFYKATTILAGWHRSTAVALVFARSVEETEDNPDRTKFKLNAAAAVSWFHRKQNPRNRTQRFGNWIAPGAGIHLISLDMGEDSVEFGVGVNGALWGGLLTAGYGWNLSVDDEREYFFVGVDLLEVLNRAETRKAAANKRANEAQ